MTFTQRLLLGFGVMSLLLLVIPSFLISTTLQRYFYELATRESHEIVEILQRKVDAANDRYRYTGQEVFNYLKRSMADYLLLDEGSRPESVFYVQVIGIKNGYVIKTPNLKDRELNIQPDNMPYQDQLRIDQNEDIPVLFYKSQLMSKNEPLAEVRVAVSLAEYQTILKQINQISLLAMLLAFALSILFAMFVSRQILKPIVNLEFEMDLMLKAEVPGQLATQNLPPDQIKSLAQKFNTLLAKLAESLHRQQRFVADASHELRSPLTAIQGHAELLKKRGQSNPEILKEGLEIIQVESIRLAKLIEDLLVLAQTYHKKPSQETLNLANIAKQVVESRQLIHSNIHFEGPSSVIMKGNAQSIRRIIINLVDNALRFTDSQERVEVKVNQKGPICILVVEDQGQGIPSDSLPHIYEHFYRIEADRNRHKGGTGLGLPIVKELVEWHQGNIDVVSEEGKGTRFTITFPTTLRSSKTES